MLNTGLGASCTPLIRTIAVVAGLAVAMAGSASTARATGTQREAASRIGTKAPTFTTTTLDGQAIDTAALSGRVMVLKFWYVACGPCRAEIPHLNKLVEEFAGQPVVFLGLALDAPEKLRLFLQEMPFRYTIVPDAEPLFERFGVTFSPTHAVIDKRGNFVYFARGGGVETPNLLRPFIKAAVGQ